MLKNKNRIKIQGLKKPVRVLGLHQLPENCDIAKAELIKKPDGYYIYLTLYRQRANKTRKNKQAHSNRLWNKTSVNTIKWYKDKLLYRRNKKTKETTEETGKTEKRKQKLSKDKREDTKGISKDIQ